jgi:PhnB protein
MSTTKASGALHTVTPYLMYRDAAGGIAFCIAAFGATEVMRHTEGERIAHAQLRIGDSLLMVSQANPAYPDMPGAEDSGPSPISLFLEVDDADATVARAVERGAVLVYPIGDREYGRSGTVRDPFGYHWHITSQPRSGALA